MSKYLTANKVWPFSFFFLFFAAVAAFMPVLVVYYQARGFSGVQIGLLTGVPPLISMATVPLWTRTADRTHQERLIMGISLLLSAAGVLVMPALTSFTAVFIVTMLFFFFLGPSLSLANSATMYMLGEERDQFGVVRVGGTIGFGAFTLIAGLLIDRLGLPATFWLGAALFVAAFLSSLGLVYDEAGPDEEEEAGEISDVLRQPNWILFLVLAFISGVALFAVNNYFYPYMAGMGASPTLTGLALTIGNLTELPVMLLANRIIGRFGGFGTLILSTGVAGLRLVLLGAVTNPAGATATQLLNGLSFPLMLVAGVYYADSHALPGLRSTSQGLFNAAILGIGAAVGGFACGILLEQIGGSAMFALIGTAVLLILAAVLIIQRRIDKKTVRSK